jgi:hypothetical protein
MSKYEVNQAAIEKIQSMIDAKQYVWDSDWSEAQPSTETENEYLGEHGWDAFGQWHLAIDTTASENTKDRYGFICGDFRRVHRSGLIAAKQRAAQNDHNEIVEVADKLLSSLDSNG